MSCPFINPATQFEKECILNIKVFLFVGWSIKHWLFDIQWYKFEAQTISTFLMQLRLNLAYVIMMKSSCAKHYCKAQ